MSGLSVRQAAKKLWTRRLLTFLIREVAYLHRSGLISASRQEADWFAESGDAYMKSYITEVGRMVLIYIFMSINQALDRGKPLADFVSVSRRCC